MTPYAATVFSDISAASRQNHGFQLAKQIKVMFHRFHFDISTVSIRNRSINFNPLESFISFWVVVVSLGAAF